LFAKRMVSGRMSRLRNEKLNPKLAYRLSTARLRGSQLSLSNH
jgi:hypothetical protein